MIHDRCLINVMIVTLIIILLEDTWKEGKSGDREGHEAVYFRGPSLCKRALPLGQGAHLLFRGVAGLHARRRRAWIPVFDQVLRLLVAHMRVPLAEAQAHHVVVHLVPDLLAVEAAGEVLVRGEQILQVLFYA